MTHKTSLTGSSFVAMPEWIASTKSPLYKLLTKTERIVYSYIYGLTSSACIYLNGIKGIQEVCGCSERTVIRTLKKLEHFGLIEQLDKNDWKQGRSNKCKKWIACIERADQYMRLFLEAIGKTIDEICQKIGQVKNRRNKKFVDKKRNFNANCKKGCKKGYAENQIFFYKNGKFAAQKTGKREDFGFKPLVNLLEEVMSTLIVMQS